MHERHGGCRVSASSADVGHHWIDMASMTSCMGHEQGAWSIYLRACMWAWLNCMGSPFVRRLHRSILLLWISIPSCMHVPHTARPPACRNRCQAQEWIAPHSTRRSLGAFEGIPPHARCWALPRGSRPGDWSL